MKPLCVAHRGCHWNCFENTIQAFEAAAKGDFWGIEMDIHLTKDKKWIVHHDPDFLSNGTKHVIKEENFEDLIKLPLDNEWNYEAFCPSLDDYLKAVHGSGKTPIIEIKPKNPSFHYLKVMIKQVKQYFTLDEVVFIAFYPWPLFKLKFLYGKKIHIQQLWEPTHPVIMKWAYNSRFDLDSDEKCLTKEIVDKFHKKGLKVNVWTIDTEESLRKFEEMCVDYITTNKFDQNS